MDFITIDLLMMVIKILAPVIGFYVIQFIRNKAGVEKMKQADAAFQVKRQLAMAAIRFVEQAYGESKGPEKFNAACVWLSDRAKEYGIKITAQEVAGLIEATLREVKDALGEEWANSTKEGDTSMLEAQKRTIGFDVIDAVSPHIIEPVEYEEDAE